MVGFFAVSYHVTGLFPDFRRHFWRHATGSMSLRSDWLSRLHWSRHLSVSLTSTYRPEIVVPRLNGLALSLYQRTEYRIPYACCHFITRLSGHFHTCLRPGRLLGPAFAFRRDRSEPPAFRSAWLAFTPACLDGISPGHVTGRFVRDDWDAYRDWSPPSMVAI